MKYLIVRCDELGDQYECDANRTPVTMTEDYTEWYINNNPEYSFEVYEYNFTDGTFELIKPYIECFEEGMCLAYYPWETEPGCNKPIVLEKFPKFTRDDKIPKHIKQRINNSKEVNNYLKISGCISWREDNTKNLYCWVEYSDNWVGSCF